MRKVLAAAGISNVWAINLEPLNGDIERLADQLAARVEDICAKTNAEKVALVGHSMGGLVSRAFARRPEGQARVERIISLGSPYHGTIHSVFSNAKNARQMRINNDWLNELNQEEEHPPAIPITSLFSYHDNIVSPQDSPMLKHAENIGFPGIGHLEMSFSKPFQQKLVEVLLENK
jgi:thioesterase domain-containing protein